MAGAGANDIFELIRAASDNNNARVIELIRAGVDVNGQSMFNGHMETPLTAAIKNDRNNIVRTLIDNGADVDLAPGQSNSPLITALLLMSEADSEEMANIIAALNEEGVNINVRVIENVDEDEPTHAIDLANNAQFRGAYLILEPFFERILAQNTETESSGSESSGSESSGSESSGSENSSTGESTLSGSEAHTVTSSTEPSPKRRKLDLDSDRDQGGSSRKRKTYRKSKSTRKHTYRKKKPTTRKQKSFRKKTLHKKH